MAGPSYASVSAGNAIASGTLTNGTPKNATVDFSTGGAFGGDIAVDGTAGPSVSTTNGLRAQLYKQQNDGSTFDTIPLFDYTISMVASTTNGKTFTVPVGIWKVVISNSDATNTITAQVTASKLS